MKKIAIIFLFLVEDSPGLTMCPPHVCPHTQSYGPNCNSITKFRNYTVHK